MSMRFTTPTSLNTIPNSIQIDNELGEIICAEVWLSHTSVTLKGQGQLK